METEQERQWRLDPKNWVWGMFYFNTEDHRILPPKRIKWMGWTVNFANVKSILFMTILLAALILLGYFSKK